MTASPKRLQFFRSLGSLGATKGFHGHTAYWDGRGERIYLHPTARRDIEQVGRGGIKSGTALDFAATEMVAGDWAVAPGERHYFAWVSENVEEAAQRPRQLETKLKALGIPCEHVGNTVELVGLPIGFKAFACRVGAVSGFRCIGFVADEMAKWRSADDGSNPAREVVASLRAMCITHPEAREWHISSPLSKLDYHYEQYAQGDNEIQVVSNAPSWIANPGITEQQTRAAERDLRIWAREYAAIPQAARLAAFSFGLVDRAFAPRAELELGEKVMVLDPSSGGQSSRDNFTWAICAWGSDRFPDDGYVRNAKNEIVRFSDGTPMKYPAYRGWKERGTPHLRVIETGCIKGGFGGSITGDEIADHLAVIAKRHNVRVVHSDPREVVFLGSAIEKRGLKFHKHDWSASSKAAAVTLLRRWLADGTLWLPAEATEMRSELLSFEEKVTPRAPIGLISKGSRSVASQGIDKRLAA